MSLIGNYSINNRVNSRQFLNTAAAGVPETITRKGAQKNIFLGAFSKLAGTPNGYSHPGSWVLPLTGGGMSSYKQMETSIVTTLAELAGGINAESNITGSISITQAQLDQIANLTAAITGNINVTQAQLAAVSALQASITASMTITNAQLGAIIDMFASLNGTLNLTNAGNFATANLEADLSLTTGGVATPAQIAAEVWDTILADHQAIGSTGKALNDAGSAGNPWSASLSSNNTPGTFGYFVQKLLTVGKFLGLK